MKHLFIINPAAGSRDQTEIYRKQIDAVCSSRGLDYRIAISAAPGNCRELAREAAESGEAYRIYACGGDGTLNEVAAGAAGFSNAAVTVFSGGSGNDFVKLFSDPKAFFDLEQLLDADEATFDMIRMGDDLALNICSVGLDARIGTDVANYKRLPLLHGFRAYVVSTVINLFKGISEHYVVEIDGKTYDSRFTFVCVCNGRFYGGGFNPVPEADPADGVLEVLLVDKVNLFQVPFLIGKYKNGRYKELGKLVRHLRTAHVKVTCDKECPFNLDGELRTAKTAEFSLAQEKLRFFYPKRLTWKKETSKETACV
ncbi:MAG: YegS/Rv2252/BmrU family lipid kinase [Clostridia bacterium]|nr:YegS/Rv2252/BmrU family lipid kinase [Clostridia bacterium]